MGTVGGKWLGFDGWYVLQAEVVCYLLLFPGFSTAGFQFKKNFFSIPPMKINRLAIIGCVLVLLGSTNMSLHGQTGAPLLSSLASLFFLNS